ncbi:MAG: pyrroline-5-carboxylate reductase [Candidatus Geothermincolia bacterium]
MTTVTFVGAGRMCEAILRSLLANSYLRHEDVILSDVNAERLAEMSERYKVRVVADNVAAVGEADVVILGVKPQNHPEVLTQIGKALREDQLLISIAVGKSTESIESFLERPVPVIRVMPNTPAMVGASLSAISYGRNVPLGAREIAHDIFNTFGETIEVDEQLQDEVAAISGCGPAYFYLMVEALIDAGVGVGLTRAVARKISVETMIGSGMMMRETGMHPSELRDMVTSPGGTTIAAVEALEEAGFRSAIFKAVQAAVRRAKQL